MKLHAEHYPGEGERPLVILHGLLGAARNWSKMARRLVPHVHVIVLDLRNHGQSPHAETMGWAELAGDVAETLAAMGVSACDVLGHSLGGKVALRLARDFPDLVRRLIVIDIAPREYPPHHQRDFEAMLALPLADLTSRKAADEHLAEAVPDWAHRQFLLTNLQRSGGTQFAWGVPLKVLYRNLDALRSDSLPANGAPAQPTLFVRGGRSRFITEDDQSAVLKRFPQARWLHFPESGHNPHFDCPDRFAEGVLGFLAADQTEGHR